MATPAVSPQDWKPPDGYALVPPADDPNQWQPPKGYSLVTPGGTPNVESSIRFLTTEDYKPPAPSITDALKSQGFLDSAWNAIKGSLTSIGDVFSGEFSRQTGEQIRQFHELEKNGTPEQKREFAKQIVFSNIPFASTIFKATHGNIPGAAGDVAGLAALPIAGKAISATTGAVKTGAGIAADIARSPLAADVVGMVSPRAGNAIRVARRGLNTIDALQEAFANAKAQAAGTATAGRPTPPTATVTPAGPPPAPAVRIAGRLSPGPSIFETPAPADTSFVRSVPAEYPPVELTAQEQALAAHILQNVEPLPPRLALPPAPQRVIVPEAPAPIPDTSFVRGVPAQLPEIVPPALRTNAPAEAAATTLRDLMQQSGTAPPPETAPPVAPEPPIDFAAAARGAKTEKLTQLLRDFEIPASDAQQMSAGDWQKLADAAGVPAPSEVTRMQVLKRLTDLERTARRSKATR